MSNGPLIDFMWKFELRIFKKVYILLVCVNGSKMGPRKKRRQKEKNSKNHGREKKRKKKRSQRQRQTTFKPVTYAKVCDIETNWNKFRRFVNRDIVTFLERHKFKITPEVIPLIAMQSIEGHARNGHGAFCEMDGSNRKRYSFPSANYRDVVKALHKRPLSHALKNVLPQHYNLERYVAQYTDSDFVAEWRERLIKDVFDFTDMLINGKKPDYCLDRMGKPLLGIESIARLKIEDHCALLNAVYFAPIMDEYDPWRKKVFEKYLIQQGGGESYRISIPVMREMGLDVEFIERNEHSDEAMAHYKESGLILDHGPISDDAALAYFRRKVGAGSVDDLALVLMGILLGPDGAKGLALGDGVDTFDKYTLNTVEGGFDHQLGKYVADSVGTIKRHYPKFELMDEETILKSMSIIAGVHYPGPHCSVRYFNQVDEKSGITALEGHLMFSQGVEIENIPVVHISHPSLKVTNHKLYRIFKEKLEEKFPEYSDMLG